MNETLQGILVFHASSMQDGWHRVKTLWFAWPGYQGPILIRGRQLDGSSEMALGEPGDLLSDPLLSAGATINGENGFREWPGATWLREPGCYAWQVDGRTFSEVIVFAAEFRA